MRVFTPQKWLSSPKKEDNRIYNEEGTGCEQVPVMASKIYPEQLQQSPKNIESECISVLRNTRNSVDISCPVKIARLCRSCLVEPLYKYLLLRFLYGFD